MTTTTSISTPTAQSTAPAAACRSTKATPGAATAGSIAVALCCGLGAQANHGYDADLGQFAPTAVQTDKMAQTVALLVTALGLQLTIDTVMTHCEAALLDGYGPYSGDAETRWDLWYMRDSPGDGQMKPGGDILRGKARWYLEHSKI